MGLIDSVKDKEVLRLEANLSSASRDMHSAESTLSSYREQIRKKEVELKSRSSRVSPKCADN